MNDLADVRVRKEVGKKLKEARIKAGFTQEELAEDANIGTNYYACIERGEVNPSLEKLKNIIKALKVKSSDILPF